MKWPSTSEAKTKAKSDFQSSQSPVGAAVRAEVKAFREAKGHFQSLCLLKEVICLLAALLLAASLSTIIISPSPNASLYLLEG